MLNYFNTKTPKMRAFMEEKCVIDYMSLKTKRDYKISQAIIIKKLKCHCRYSQ